MAFGNYCNINVLHTASYARAHHKDIDINVQLLTSYNYYLGPKQFSVLLQNSSRGFLFLFLSVDSKLGHISGDYLCASYQDKYFLKGP